MPEQTITADRFAVSLTQKERTVIDKFLSELMALESDNPEDAEVEAQVTATIKSILDLFRQTMDYAGVTDPAVSGVKISYLMTAAQVECLTSIADGMEESTMEHIMANKPIAFLALKATKVFAAVNLQLQTAYPQLF